MDVRAYLNSKGWQWREINRPAGPQAVLNCPFCGDREKSFAISLADGAWNCLRLNNCGKKGSFIQLQKEMGDNPMPVDSARMFSVRPLPKLKDYKRPTIETPPLAEHVYDWLITTRKFNRATIDHFDLRQNSKATGICWPYFKNGELVNLKWRAIAEKKFHNEKGTEPTLFNRDRCAENKDRLIIVEGEFDCMALHQYGIESVSVPNGTGDCRWIDNEWDYCQQFQEIILCLDNDAPGWKLRDELIQRFGRWRCRVMVLPHKDANECLIQNVPQSIITAALENATGQPPELLTCALDYIDDVADMFENPELYKGMPTAFPELDRLLGGWRHQELTVWSGSNGSGKSTILNQVMLDILRRGVPVCMASLELPPQKYLRWAAMQWTEKKKLTRPEVTEAFYQFGPNLFIINTHEEIEPERVLDCFIYAARRYGVKHFIVDSLTRLMFPGRDENAEHKKFTSSFLSFVKAHNAHGHLVVHPRKGATDEDKPGKVDVGGTGHITNLAHNVLIMWRPNEDLKERAVAKGDKEPNSLLLIRKNREEGEEGKVRFVFNPEIKKFFAVAGQIKSPAPDFVPPKVYGRDND